MPAKKPITPPPHLSPEQTNTPGALSLQRPHEQTHTPYDPPPAAPRPRWRPLVWHLDASCELRLFRMDEDLAQYRRVHTRLREARRCLRESTAASRCSDATAKERREAKIATTRMLSVVRSLEDTLELMDHKGCVRRSCVPPTRVCSTRNPRGRTNNPSVPVCGRGPVGGRA